MEAAGLCPYVGASATKNPRFLRVGEALILGTMMVGQATAFAPNYNKAVLAAARIFKLLDRQPKIDSTGAAGLKLVRGDCATRPKRINYIDFFCLYCAAVH